MNKDDLDFIKASGGPLAPVHTVVGKEQDSEGNELTIWFCDIIAQTPALAPFLRGYAELIDQEFASPYVAWGEINKLHIVYAINAQEQFVGGIAFEYRQTAREGWLVLSFTEKEFRGRRVNQVLHQYFEEIVRRRGGNRIASFVHINNVSRLKSAERVDFVPQYYRMVKPV